MEIVRQGEILKIERPKTDILVLSKDFFNESGLVMVCPVVNECSRDALHIPVKGEGYSGIAMLEQLRSLDINSRYYKKIAEISFDQIQNISDAVQGIFDYYPWSI